MDVICFKWLKVSWCPIPVFSLGKCEYTDANDVKLIIVFKGVICVSGITNVSVFAVELYIRF